MSALSLRAEPEGESQSAGRKRGWKPPVSSFRLDFSSAPVRRVLRASSRSYLEGGVFPLWPADGRELFFQAADGGKKVLDSPAAGPTLIYSQSWSDEVARKLASR
jgi:hypothetical protein